MTPIFLPLLKVGSRDAIQHDQARLDKSHQVLEEQMPIELLQPVCG
jgi:hypothetical protein